ncbi:MAG TPA: VWA domain-containing protein [Herpetosiphonaceae bacterium]|nr:VWA domain-containing protein [Herpetosiphonaceae bacterium]
MTFLLPLGLLGLLVVPLIGLLHLIRERRRRVRIPSLELWQSAAAPLQRRPRRLPLTLLLLLHLLIAALLGMSLGRPALSRTTFAPRSTVVVVDTSTSMAARDGGRASDATRLDAAKEAGRQILESTRDGDTVALVTLGATPRLEGSGGAEAVPALAGVLAALRPAGPDGDLTAALSLATAAASEREGAPAPHIVVLTDSAFAGRAASSAPPTITGELTWRTFGDAADNVAIVAFAARPLRSGAQQIYARVANLGARPASRTLAVVLDGETVAQETVRLEAGTEAEWSWPVRAGARIAEARLEGVDVAPVDDRAFAVLTGGTAVRVELVSAAPTTLERALRAQPRLEVALQSPDQYRHDPAAALAVFVGFVPPELPPVPTLIVAPPPDNVVVPVAEVENNLRADSTSDSRFASIDVRGLRFNRVARIETPAWLSVAVAAEDTPLVLTGVFQGHPRAVWTFDPAGSDLAGRLAFPLLAAATLRTLVPYAGGALALGDAAPTALVAPSDATLSPGSVLDEPGVYRWEGQEGAVAVNALDAAEANLQRREPPAVETVAAGRETVVEQAARELWRPVLGGALLLLLLEWLYSHRRSLPRPGAMSAPSRRRRSA